MAVEVQLRENALVSERPEHHAFGPRHEERLEPLLLDPGEDFQYTSACPLDTPVGTMHGEFNMVQSDTREAFDARIAPFRLAVPNALN